MTAYWLALRYFGSWRRFFSMSTSLSVLGMTIGVSTLVVSMAVFTSYSKTLEKTVQDAFGHLVVIKVGEAERSEISDDWLKEIRPLVQGYVAETPFVTVEAMLAHAGKISGILVEGVDPTTLTEVLNVKARLVSGDIDFGVNAEGLPKVLIGKGIAQKFGLKVGDVFRVVIPLSKDFQAETFKQKLGKFVVAGVVNYGRYDFDSRYIMMSMSNVQEFAEIGTKPTGYRIRIEDPSKARASAQAIGDRFRPAYRAIDWQDFNRNLFEAARFEKMILFFVLMILVVAAAFNIANTLFISVVRRYRDISVLKTLGATNGLIRMIFSVQGLMVGAVGALLGVVLGLGLCQLLEWVQTKWKIIPPEVYKLDYIEIQVNMGDLFVIVGASLLICFIATLVPSQRGAQISPVEGLRYE